MADTTLVYFAIKRTDLNDEDVSEVVSLEMSEDDKVADATHRMRSLLQIKNHDRIFKLRNWSGSMIPLNGKLCYKSSSSSRPFTLEVVRQFQSVRPEPNSLELSKYADTVKDKLTDIQDRIALLEDTMENISDKREEKVAQEVSKLEKTVSFVVKRLEEAESIQWCGMFSKNPLW